MSLEWLAGAAGAVAFAYVAFLAALVLAGRSSAAVAAARVIPDSVVLMRRLMGDSRIPRRRKAALPAAIAYLAVPIDLVPDFVPVAGQLDDVLVVALALRYLLRSSDPGLIEELWPGPAESLKPLLRLAYGPEALPVGPSCPSCSQQGSSPRRHR